jgi:hypothetical protein
MEKRNRYTAEFKAKVGHGTPERRGDLEPDSWSVPAKTHKCSEYRCPAECYQQMPMISNLAEEGHISLFLSAMCLDNGGHYKI